MNQFSNLNGYYQPRVCWLSVVVRYSSGQGWKLYSFMKFNHQNKSINSDSYLQRSLNKICVFGQKGQRSCFFSKSVVAKALEWQRIFWLSRLCPTVKKQQRHWYTLVGGFKPSEKHAGQIGNLPQFSGWVKYSKPPPSWYIVIFWLLHCVLCRWFFNIKFHTSWENVRYYKP